MTKLLVTFLMLFPLTVLAQRTTPVPAMSTPALRTQKDEEEKPFKAKKGHFIVSFGAETLKYDHDTFFAEGVKNKELTKGYNRLYGFRLGMGPEIYIGESLLASTKLEGYYAGTVFTKAQTADPNGDESIDVAAVKNTGQIYGLDLVQSLSFMFDWKIYNPLMSETSYLIVEPFVEAGIGWAQGFNKVDYFYNTGLSGVHEEYELRTIDTLTNARIGAGINLTSLEGYFFYIKASLNRYGISERNLEGYKLVDNTTTPVPINEKSSATSMDPIGIYSLGGGYKF